MTKKKKLLVFGVVAFFIIWIGAVFWANHNKESRSDSAERRVAVYTIPDPQKIYGEGQFQYQNEVSFTVYAEPKGLKADGIACPTVVG